MIKEASSHLLLDIFGFSFSDFIVRLCLEILADSCEQPAKALQRLFVRRSDQLLDALVHDPGGQHLELVQLADEADIAERSPSRSHLLFLPLGLFEFN